MKVTAPLSAFRVYCLDCRLGSEESTPNFSPGETFLAHPLRPDKSSDPWPSVCLIATMNVIVFRAIRKSGDYVSATMLPANHSEEVRLSWVDGVIAAVFLACVGGLICLLAAG